MAICSKEKCTACGVCEAICPENAIKYKADNKGFLYPEIDADKCIKCGLCSKKCTENNLSSTNGEPLKVYATINRNKKLLKNCSSGGIFPLLSRAIIQQNGVVFGVKWDADFSTCHSCAQSVEELSMLYGSKYVQCKPNKIFQKVKDFLNQDKKVLFSGTPCQVAALKVFLGKNYENLYTVDLVCHGVPSYEIFQKHLSEITSNNLDLVKNVNLRYKKPCWSYSSVKVDFKNKDEYLKLTIKDAFFNLFNFNYSLRECCHNCRYATTQRQADITLSDFWGYVPKSFKTRNFDKGISCVLINTDKGQAIFNKINRSIIMEERSIEEAQKANMSLTKPFAAPDNIQDFWYDYEQGMTIANLNDKYVVKPYSIPKFLWLRRIKRKYKWILGK